MTSLEKTNIKIIKAIEEAFFYYYFEPLTACTGNYKFNKYTDRYLALPVSCEMHFKEKGAKLSSSPPAASGVHIWGC